MSLVPHLLQAIVAANGEAVVLRSGHAPYVSCANSDIEIATDSLTFEAVNAILKELLPEASLRAFDQLGSIKYQCPPLAAYPVERFSVVALREGAQLWAEIRRAGGSAQPAAARAVSTGAVVAPVAETESKDDLAVPDFEDLWPGQPSEQTPDSGSWRAPEAIQRDESDDPPALPEARTQSEAWIELDALDRHAVNDLASGPEAATLRDPVAPPRVPDPPAVKSPAVSDFDELNLVGLLDDLPRSGQPSPARHVAPPPLEARSIVTETAKLQADSSATDAPALDIHAVPPRQAVVAPMARTHIRNFAPGLVDLTAGGLVRLLRIVAARGGSALFIASDAQPSTRVDGEMRALDDEELLTAADVETLLLGVMPKRTHQALRSGERTEWIMGVRGLGRVRCVSFHDHGKVSGTFRILSARAESTEQLGLSREAQALALETEGLVLIAGPPSSGKSTLIAAFVDLINRTRRDHVITIENEIQVVHESQGSTVSQREIRGDGPCVLAAARGALREDPDVLVIEELRDDDITHLALEAAGSGRLVIAGLPAHTSMDAVDRFLDHYTSERRRHAQLALAENLRGIIVQSLLSKSGVGRVVAREVLLNTPDVASLIADGRTSELPLAIEKGRKIGMMLLNESLAELVESSAVDVREAYRHAGDRHGLLALLERRGVLERSPDISPDAHRRTHD